MTQKYTVEARELHPVTGEPLGEWTGGDDDPVEREEAVRLADAVESVGFGWGTYKARIRPCVPPYYVETP